MCQSGSDREMPPRWHPNGSEKKSKFPDERSFQIVGVSGRLGAEHTDRTGAGGDCDEDRRHPEKGEGGGGGREVAGGSAVLGGRDGGCRAAQGRRRDPQDAPVHPPEHYDGTSFAVPVVEPPAKLKYLALFALEMEERGFEVEPDEEEDWEDEDEDEEDDEDEEEDDDNNDDD